MRFSFQAPGEFDISLFDHSELSLLLQILRKRLAGRRCVFVTTPTVYRTYRESFFDALGHGPDGLLVIQGGETAKTLETALTIVDLCVKAELDRLGVIVGIGGGTCTDLVGFAASLIRRGIAHIRVPTTLVGQIDAAIGLKSGVNYARKKNYLGAFHAPEHVLVCPAFLKSLPKRQIREGMSEILKIALVRDPVLFELLDSCGTQLIDASFCSSVSATVETLTRSIIGMVEELEANPFEKKSFRRKVDYGHCFSPLIESASGYRTPHGEAVGVDIALSVYLAEDLGLLHADARRRILALFHKLELPRQHGSLTLRLCQDALEAAANHRGGLVNLPLTKAIGEVAFIEHRDAVSAEALQRSLQALERDCRPALHHDPAVS